MDSISFRPNLFFTLPCYKTTPERLRELTLFLQVTSAHQKKLEELRGELGVLEANSSEYSVIKKKADIVESVLPEDERSEIEAELECPVCLGKD